MSTVLSALVVVCALAASGVLLVQLAMSESRRGRRSGVAAPAPAPAPVAPPTPGTIPVRPAQPERQTIPVQAVPAAYPTLPERALPPPPAPRVRRGRARPAAAVMPVQQAQHVAWAPTLSPDGAWLWTGSAWVPAWWGGPTVPPPPPYATAAPPRPARSHGCLAALGMGCLVVLGIAALIVIVAVAAAGGLTSLTGG